MVQLPSMLEAIRQGSRPTAREAERLGLPPSSAAVRGTRQHFDQDPLYGDMTPALPSTQTDPYADPEDRSALQEIGSAAIGGLVGVANILDTPGAMVRNLLTGRDVLDPLMNPWSGGDRATGRDVLELFGMRKNKETGFVPLEDTGEFLRDVAGFGAEIFLDPLSFVNLGARAATQTGRAVQKAGLYKKLPDIINRAYPRRMTSAMAADRLGMDEVLKRVDAGDAANIETALRNSGIDPASLGADAIGGSGPVFNILQEAGLDDLLIDVARSKFPSRMGKREAMTRATLRDVYSNISSKQRQQLDKALENVGVKEAGKQINPARLDDPLTGKVGFGLPFGEPRFTVGTTGKFAQNHARLVDQAARALSQTRMVRYPNMLFNHLVRGEHKFARQLLMRRTSEALDEMSPELGNVVNDALQKQQELVQMFASSAYGDRLITHNEEYMTDLVHQQIRDQLESQFAGAAAGIKQEADRQVGSQWRKIAAINGRAKKEGGKDAIERIAREEIAKGNATADELFTMDGEAIRLLKKQEVRDQVRRRFTQEQQLPDDFFTEELSPTYMDQVNDVFDEQVANLPPVSDLKVGDSVVERGLQDETGYGQITGIGPDIVEVTYKFPATGVENAFTKTYRPSQVDLRKVSEDVTGELTGMLLDDLVNKIVRATAETSDTKGAFAQFLQGKLKPEELENLDQTLIDSVNGVAKTMLEMNRTVANTIERMGGDITLMDPDLIKHMHRTGGSAAKRGVEAATKRDVPTKAGGMMAREHVTRNLPTHIVNDLANDPRLKDNLPKDSMEILLEEQGQHLDPNYVPEGVERVNVTVSKPATLEPQVAPSSQPAIEPFGNVREANAANPTFMEEFEYIREIYPSDFEAFNEMLDRWSEGIYAGDRKLTNAIKRVGIEMGVFKPTTKEELARIIESSGSGTGAAKAEFTMKKTPYVFDLDRIRELENLDATAEATGEVAQEVIEEVADTAAGRFTPVEIIKEGDDQLVNVENVSFSNPLKARSVKDVIDRIGRSPSNRFLAPQLRRLYGSEAFDWYKKTVSAQRKDKRSVTKKLQSLYKYVVNNRDAVATTVQDLEGRHQSVASFIDIADFEIGEVFDENIDAFRLKKNSYESNMLNKWADELGMSRRTGKNGEVYNTAEDFMELTRRIDALRDLQFDVGAAKAREDFMDPTFWEKLGQSVRDMGHDGYIVEGEGLVAKVNDAKGVHAYQVADWAKRRKIPRRSDIEERFLPEPTRIDPYPHDNVADFFKYQEEMLSRKASIQGIHLYVADTVQFREAIDNLDDMVPLHTAYKNAGMNPDNSIDFFRKHNNIPEIGETGAALQGPRPSGVDDAAEIDELSHGMYIPKEAADAIAGVSRVVSYPEWANKIGKFVNAFNRHFKTAVTLPFPGFVLRNSSSGHVVNVTSGHINNPKQLARYGKKVYETFNALRTQGDIKYHDEILQYGVFDKRATGFLDIERIGQTLGEEDLSRLSGAPVVDMSSVYPDPILFTEGTKNPIQSLKGWFGRGQAAVEERMLRPDADEKFINRLSAKSKTARKARETYNAWITSGQSANDLAEGVNRISMYSYLRDEGFVPQQAAKIVEELHFDYGKLAPFEKTIMRGAIPFWTFTRNVVPLTIKTLYRQPGGPLSQLIQLTASGRGEQQFDPEHVARTAAIPWQQTERGATEYLTGLGLAHEDALKFMDPGIAMDILGRANPLFKMPLELATNTSFFQNRSLDLMDPVLGRIAANIAGEPEGPLPPKYKFGGQYNKFIEQLVSNSPLARAATTARQMTDTRAESDIPQKLLRLMTGLKFTTVEPYTREAVMRDALEERATELGMRSFQTVQFPEERIAALPEADQERVRRLKRIRDMLVRNVRTRSREEAGLDLPTRLNTVGSALRQRPETGNVGSAMMAFSQALGAGSGIPREQARSVASTLRALSKTASEQDARSYRSLASQLSRLAGPSMLKSSRSQ